MYEGWGAARNLEAMTAELEEYYGCAGFADFKAWLPGGVSARRIRELYFSTFGAEEAPDEETFILVSGRQMRNGEVCA